MHKGAGHRGRRTSGNFRQVLIAKLGFLEVATRVSDSKFIHLVKLNCICFMMTQ